MTSAPPKTIAFGYGLFEGPAHGYFMRRECRQRGYSITNDLEKADIIIAHSSGWLAIPDTALASRIMLIDPSYKTARSTAARFIQRLRYDSTHTEVSGRQLYLRLWNIIEVIAHIPRWLNMRRQFNTRDITPLIRQPRVTVIHTSDPAWWDETTMESARHIMHVPRDHDRCWRDPKPFLNTI